MADMAIKVTNKEADQLLDILDFYLENREQEESIKATYMFAAHLQEMLETRKWPTRT